MSSSVGDNANEDLRKKIFICSLIIVKELEENIPIICENAKEINKDKINELVINMLNRYFRHLFINLKGKLSPMYITRSVESICNIVHRFNKSLGYSYICILEQIYNRCFEEEINFDRAELLKYIHNKNDYFEELNNQLEMNKDTPENVSKFRLEYLTHNCNHELLAENKDESPIVNEFNEKCKKQFNF
jgi:hypothetical protein